MNPKKYKIGVIGLGPVGLMLGHYFNKANCDVVLCSRNEEHIDLIKSEGVHLAGTKDERSQFSEICSSIEDLVKSNVDIIVSAVKAYQIDSVLHEINLHNRNPSLMIIAAQNGIGIVDKYSFLFDLSKIFRFVINFAGNMNAPNVVNVTFIISPNYIASVDDSRPDISKWIEDVLSSVELFTKSVDSFELTKETWHKTILNASLSPLCAISKLTMREAMKIPDTNEIIERIIMEAMEVAKAEDIRFEKNFVKLCLRYLSKAGNHFPSLAVDLLNKKQTEIDFINGQLVQYGRKHYIRTPLNLTFTNMIRAITKENLKSNQPTLTNVNE